MPKYKNPQEWLNHQYSDKDQVEKIGLINLNFEQPGELVITDYPNLKGVKKNWNQEVLNITKLTIRDCPQLERIDISHFKDNQELILTNLPNLKELKCYGNNLVTLDLTNLSNLEYINCSFNKLAEVKLPSTAGEKLKRLALKSNKFNQDLSFLSGLVNLREFDLGDNSFYGSLSPLQELTKLEKFDINDTDIDSGLEYLPESVKELDCSARYRKDAKCQVIFNLFANDQGIKNYSQRLQDLKNSWTKLGFVEEEMKAWTKAGLKINEAELALYLKQKSHQPNSPNIQEIISQESWRDIHEYFDYLLRKNWEQKKFSRELVKKWITAGAKVDDYEFITWLNDVKKLGSEWITKYKEDYQTLSERFKKYGLCPECDQPNTGENWCQPCNKFHLFSQQASNNSKVNEFIQKYQLEATEANKFIEWIPYEQFMDIEHIADGGFGKVYKAKWMLGNVLHWDVKNEQWKREKDYYFDKKKKKYKDYKEIVLKSLNNSSQNTELLQEIMKHKIIDDWFNNIVPCYGLSQDPNTGNYLMVMQYMPEGNLRHYLQNNQELSFRDKLKKLFNIAQGLKDIHQKNLMHCDFHSGNILNNSSKSFITDLGLCRPANEKKIEKIYGVLPYVAPELFQDKCYTQASDVYSFGIVAYEILSGSPPYYDIPYADFLAIWICRGLRPNLDNILAPQLLKNLIQKCWNADPINRPTTSDLKEILRSWYLEINRKESTEFNQQCQEIEKAKKENLCQSLSGLYQQYKGQIKKVEVKEIKKAKEELFPEFWNQHKGKEKDARELFDKIIASKQNYQLHLSSTYTSRLLDFKNLPEPQNSKEINEIFYRLKESGDLDSLRIISSGLTREIIDWQNLHPNFTPNLTQSWINHNFNYQQTQEWINIGLTPNDYNFAHFLKTQKNLTAEDVLNYGNLEELKQEFIQSQQTAQIQINPFNKNPLK